MNALQEANDSICRHNRSIAKSVILWPIISLFLASCGGGDSNSSGGLTNKDFTVTAGSYGEVIFTEEDTPSPLTGPDLADVNTTYVSDDEDVCTVNSETGTVTGVNEGECRVTLTLSKVGYNDKIIEYITPVVLSPNVIKGQHIFKGLLLGQYTKPVLADVDGDNDDDLVVGLSNGTLKYYRRNASDAPNAFTQRKGADNPFNNINVGEQASPTFTYINRDNKLDLVVGEKNGTLKFYLNESTTESIIFTEKTSSENPFNGIDVGTFSTPTFADVDGDSDLDLVVGNIREL